MRVKIFKKKKIILSNKFREEKKNFKEKIF
jgi:hypothetical protein